MRLTLIIQSGDQAGRRFIVEPGQTIRVGRTAPAEVLLRDDPLLSNVHFAIDCGEEGCQITDPGSKFGTYIGGQQVKGAAALRGGDEIRAGRTAFRVEVDGQPAAPPSPRPAVVAPPLPAPLLAEGLASRGFEVLRLRKEPLFAVLDAAREPSIVPRLLASGEQHQSLYDGPKGAEFAPYGPWLVELPRPKFAEELVRDGWGKSWGIFLSSRAGFADIRKHLRRFTTVQMPDGTPAYFRFYDPRVLRIYLPTCTVEELRAFFGPVDSYLIEDAEPSQSLLFTSARPEPMRLGTMAETS
jgi:Domain of unknown function (DUF4123)/Inner membrane component of T3SS, cytoplasmic domain